MTNACSLISFKEYLDCVRFLAATSKIKAKLLDCPDLITNPTHEGNLMKFNPFFLKNHFGCIYHVSVTSNGILTYSNYETGITILKWPLNMISLAASKRVFTSCVTLVKYSNSNLSRSLIIVSVLHNRPQRTTGQEYLLRCQRLNKLVESKFTGIAGAITVVPFVNTAIRYSRFCQTTILNVNVLLNRLKMIIYDKSSQAALLNCFGTSGRFDIV